MIPHTILSDHLENRIDGRRVLAAVFLTFEFDPCFFEQQVLPVLLGLPVAHARNIRLAQLDDALRDIAGNIAVFYDANGLVVSSDGSAHLDCRRIPVRHQTGVFHPKNVFILLEGKEAGEDGRKPQSLLIGALSANLTRSGWWENVEAFHFEELQEYEATQLKDNLVGLLDGLKTKTRSSTFPVAVGLIRDFLRTCEQRTWRMSGGRLLPHFYNGTGSFPDFLEAAAGDAIRGMNLEVISPYLDQTKTAVDPIGELINRFKPRAVRVFLPRNRQGLATCTPAFDSRLRSYPNVVWGRLPAERMTGGTAAGATDRFVHAKVYRFFSERPKREICFVGSVNLTTPAHQSGGNWETGVLVEVDCLRAPDFWLEDEHTVPSAFSTDEANDTTADGGTPLQVRFHWDQQNAEYLWDAKHQSPPLQLKMRGVALCSFPPIGPREWRPFTDDIAEAIREYLRETSFIEVTCDGQQAGFLLIQEEGMAHKPSLLLSLSAAEILRYWAQLTPDQRMAFIEAKALEGGLDLAQDGCELLARTKIQWGDQTFFDRFAGIFHAFSCLDRAVRTALTTKPSRWVEADYRLFGKKYDSLGTLIDRVGSTDSSADDVERFVILLCVLQLRKDIERDFPEYWEERKSAATELDANLQKLDAIRGRLVGICGTQGEEFLQWFERRFVQRAKGMEARS